MNKSELIDQIAEKADVTKAVAARTLDATLEAITGALKAKESVVLVGFGSFEVKERSARTGRNPQTGKPIEIKASRVPAFRPGATLKTSVQ